VCVRERVCVRAEERVRGRENKGERVRATKIKRESYQYSGVCVSVCVR